MQLLRMFSTEKVKGTRNYLNSQKKYEVLRTVLYFAVSLSLFAAGCIQTGSRMNLLTVVAVLGCLPASKSAVNAIMFLRFHSCSTVTQDAAAEHSEGLDCLYDCVFTSYKQNFTVAHLAVRANTICGFSEDRAFDENAFYSHINDILKMDGHKNMTVKIFTSLSKYTERLEQLKGLENDTAKTASVLATLKSVML
ncbi:MAG: hypothetical protein ACI4AB_08880 [Acetatifactor sp.]